MSCAPDNQFRHHRDIPKFNKICRDFEVPVIFPDFLLDDFNASFCPFQSLVRSNDSDIVPHKSPDLIPVLRNHNDFITVCGSDFIPCRRVRGKAKIQRIDILEGLSGSHMGINQCFDQRVACKSVGPVQSGTGCFADGVESMQIRFTVHIGCNAPAHIMGRRNNRERFLCHIKTECEALFI